MAPGRLPEHGSARLVTVRCRRRTGGDRPNHPPGWPCRGRREQEPSFFTVIVWRDQAEHAAESLSKGSRVVVVGRLQQRAWTAEDGSTRSTIEIMADDLGPSLRWATATTTRATRSQ
jgi:single stranded DNA-binding protein